MKENVFVFVQISLKFVPNDPIDSKSADRYSSVN